MAGSRGPTPLFEVLANRGGLKDADGSSRPTVAGTPRPTAEPPRPPEQTSAIPAPDPVRNSQGRIAVPIATLYASLAAVLIACLLMFMIGFRVGQSRAEDELTGRLSPMELVPLVDPLLETAEPAGGPEPNESSGTPSVPVRSPDPTPVDPSTAVLSPRGPITDPRLDGHNYLELALLSRDQAVAAVTYLSQAGVDAIAVPVDRGGRRTNNAGPGRHRVVALSLAIPSGRYSSMGAERSAFETRLRELGRRWVAEGGSSDFRDPLWRRFER
ncbi:MAG: hypothetical protein AAGI53_13875 [Planctomycetota bacterium]